MTDNNWVNRGGANETRDTTGRVCDRCGAEMEVIDSWSSKSPPLIGATIEQIEFRCPDCGNKTHLKRKESDEDWQLV